MTYTVRKYFFFRHKTLQGLRHLHRTQPRRGLPAEQSRLRRRPLIREKLFGFFAGEYLNQVTPFPAAWDFTANSVTGGSASLSCMMSGSLPKRLGARWQATIFAALFFERSLDVTMAS